MPKRKSHLDAVSKNRKVAPPKEPHDALGNPVNYYVKFYLAGLNKPVCYKVHKNDWDEMSGIFWEHREIERPIRALVDFTDICDDTLVRVNPQYVRLYQALYDVGDFQKGEPREPDRIIVYMAGLSEPLHFDGMEDEDIASLNEGLDCFEDQGFVSFVDQDGENNSIQVRSIVLIETPNLAMFDGSVMSWNPATQEYETPRPRYDDDDET